MNRSTLLTLRGGGAAVLAGGLIALGSLPASAHVHVHADSTESGSWAALTFRVPNESDSASTTQLVVTLPQDTPLASVSVRPVPGWTAEVETETLPEPVEANDLTITEAPRTITWTAGSSDAAIAPGQYQEFSISGGPLPGPGTLVLPAEQTYSDGEVVDWDDAPSDGGEEPEHPAPTVEVTAATEAGDDGAADAAADDGGGDTTAAQDESRGSTDTLARALGGLALVVALVGAGIAILAGRSRRA